MIGCCHNFMCHVLSGRLQAIPPLCMAIKWLHLRPASSPPLPYFFCRCTNTPLLCSVSLHLPQQTSSHRYHRYLVRGHHRWRRQTSPRRSTRMTRTHRRTSSICVLYCPSSLHSLLCPPPMSSLRPLHRPSLPKPDQVPLHVGWSPPPRLFGCTTNSTRYPLAPC